MTKKWFLWIFCMLFSVTFSQERTNHYQTKKIPITKDTVFLESVSINPAFFSIKDKNQNKIDSTITALIFKKPVSFSMKILTLKIL